jgi:excisionase family DNA binding protein
MNTTKPAIANGGERIAYKPSDAAKAIGISRGQLYILMARGEIPARKMGVRTLIAATDLQAFVARQPLAQFTSVHAKPAA